MVGCMYIFLTFVSCLLTVTLHIVDVRLTCLMNITYLLMLNEAKTSRPRPRPKLLRPRPRSRLATCRYFSIRTHGDNAKNTITEFVSHIRELNHVFVMNVAMIQPRNGYNQYIIALDSTFFEAKLSSCAGGRHNMPPSPCDLDL